MNNYSDYDKDLYPEAIEESYDYRANEGKYLATPYEALVRGNIFNELYSPYKNYKPKNLNPTTEKGKLLLDLRMYNQALIDLNLFLDLKPNDTNIINIRADYLSKYNKTRENYEKKYGPIGLDSEYTKQSPWAWDEDNFPWEVRD